ncbi:MAG: hypothetical protein ACOY4R_29215 [Pseudomonadota bacterium]
MARPPANTTATTALTDADLRSLLGRLVIAAGPPPAPVNTQALLAQKPRVTVAFPPCASELLSLVRPAEPNDEISGFFREYFRFTRHRVLGQDLNGQELDTQLSGVLDADLLGCLAGPPGGPVITRSVPAWPSDCCICSPCVTLDGNRNPPPSPLPNAGGIRRLFAGDVVWLFYFERMGLNQILGAILDAYAYNGRLPISSGAVEPGVLDDIVGLVLEIMVRQTSMGLSSRARDRALMLRRSVGWTSEAGRKLNVDSEVNSSFNVLFHKFLFHALEYYRDKRLAVAIQGVTTAARPSAATLVTISETLELLTKRFEPFYYGRNYYNALNGIVWSIAALTMIRALARTLGIPGAFGDPHEFVPAAYDLLVLKRPVTSGDTNRYIVHRECARHGRDLLLDMEVIDFRDTQEGGALDAWLTQVEGKVEAYRTSYRSMTGVDIGASATPTIEQQA